jgi:formylglycine-generating enzyme required for sulfatase activity
MRRLFVLLAVSQLGCAAIAGVDDYQAVDCEGPSCTESDSGLEETGADIGVAETDVDSSAIDSSLEDSTASDAKDSGVDTGKDTAVPDTGPVICSAAPTKVVSLGTWSIDATEVTNAQYAAFLAAKAGATTGQPAFCSWNTSFVPASSWPAPAAKCDLPVANVDWCDAWAYCAWAKKRLCGNPTGGATTFDGSGPTTVATSQWYAACSVGGIGKYPYGDMWSSGTCVDNAYDGVGGTSPSDGPVRVGTAKSCHGVAGAYAQLFDLVGNVREWEDDCDGTKGGGDNCRTRGGSFTEGGDKATCTNTFPVHRDATADNVGFRCCSP